MMDWLRGWYRDLKRIWFLFYKLLERNHVTADYKQKWRNLNFSMFGCTT